MDTKDKLMGIALILAGVACIVLGLAFSSKMQRANNNTNNNELNKPVQPYVDIYNDYGM